MRKIELKPLVDLAGIIEENYHIIDIVLTDNKNLYLLIQELRNDGKEYQYIWEQLIPNYKIIQIENNQLKEIFKIENSETNYHFIREAKGNFLLASARCQYTSELNIEKNVSIINNQGEIINRFVAGDGIQDIKIFEDNIWISYFDEGVYGNYGWDIPHGRNGLVCLDFNGNHVYQYEPVANHEHIDDCYSMTLDVEGNPWFYYYSEFCLCHKGPEGLVYYNPNVSGSSNLLVSDTYIMMDRGYNKKSEYVLYDKSNLKQKSSFTFTSENRPIIERGFKYFNNSLGVAIENSKIYVFDLSTI